MKWPTSEVALARPIVARLRELQWVVYQEVKLRAGDERADIVAVQGKIVWIVECKCVASLAVVQQAYNWHQYAHFISIGIPRRRHRPWVFHEMLDHLGMGMIEVSKTWKQGETADCYNFDERPGRFNRRALSKHILGRLVDEQQTYAEAGNAGGACWSPFKATCTHVAEFVKNNPGVGMKEMLAKVETHYANKRSAQGSLARWIKAAKVKGVELRKEGRHLRLYPKEV